MTNCTTDTTPTGRPVSAFDEGAWNGLCDETGPFVDWRFLVSAEQAGCTGAQAGWQPLALAEPDEKAPLCAAPAWLKSHSHGEFVFDFAWAHASERLGAPWYPKILVAAPFTPVTGPRLIGGDRHEHEAMRLIERIESLVERNNLSSAGVNFCGEHDTRLLREAGWLERFDWQYHWHNAGYRDFDDFLDRMRRKPRKNIRNERRRVERDGWRFRWRDGDELDAGEMDLIDRCYETTFALYGNLPSLNRAFFELAARRFGDRFLACIASHGERDLAVAVFWRDDRRLFGRYWGSLVETRDVHFEACYYQGIDYCIRHGLTWFEPGAQGEHKIRRGFLPRKTRSFHYIRDPILRQGIQRWLTSEGALLEERRRELDTLFPFQAT